MTILHDAEQAAETAVPGLRAARWAIDAAIILLVLGAAVVAIWWLIIRPLTDQQRAAQAKVDATLGNATGTITTSIIPQLNENARRKTEINAAVQKGTSNVRAAPDAGQSARGVSDATLRALCLLDDAPDSERAEQPVHVDPACERFARPDAGSEQGHD